MKNSIVSQAKKNIVESHMNHYFREFIVKKTNNQLHFIKYPYECQVSIGSK